MAEPNIEVEKLRVEIQRLQMERANVITETKNRILSEGMKGLFLINGGGAIALAAWIQAVWEKDWAAPMLKLQLFSLGLFAIGVIFAALSPVARYLVFHHKNTLTPSKNPFWWTHMAVTALSILSFAIATGLIVKGGLEAFDKRPVTMTPNSGVQPTPKSGAADAKR